MKRILIITFCGFLPITGISADQSRPLANENKSGLYAKSIEQVLRLDADEIDLATAVLIVSEQWNKDVYAQTYLSKLDDMATEIRNRLEAKGVKINQSAIGLINEYLFDELGFASVSDANDSENLFLHSVMDRKRGYCLSLSILYLSIGERLGLPLYGVVVPGHFFVRYDDGRARFNIETTAKGGYASDEHYVDKFKVPKGKGESIYMINLNKKQTLGCFFNNLGNSYSNINDVERASSAFESAVEINPSLAELRSNLGNVYMKKGRVEDAMREYRNALEINPNDAKTHNNLGNAYVKKDWWNEAISEYTESLSLDPNFASAHRNLASAYCKKEMFMQAIAELKQAISLEPKDSGLYSQLGDVYSQRGDLEEAMAQYEKALKVKLDCPEAYYGMAVCYNKQGLAENEIESYEKALAVKPDMTAALMNLGNAYCKKKKYDSAIELYKRAKLTKPNDAAIRYNLGIAYLNNGSYEQAASEYQKAIEIDPKMGDAHYGIGCAYYNLKKYELAWQHIQTAQGLGVDIPKDLLAAVEKGLKQDVNSETETEEGGK
jgi:tetratricopeptide (TPR) repeat protein